MVDKTEFKITPNDKEEEFAVEFGEVINLGGSGGTSDFNDLNNRPKYDGVTMTGDTDIPKTPSKTSELENDSDYQTGTEVQNSIYTAISEIDIPTYSDFVGTDGQIDGTHGLVPAPTTTDAGKFLKADGTWDTAGGGGPTVVQTTGTSTTDVMSQNAVTDTLFNSSGVSGDNIQQRIKIGKNSVASGSESTAVGSRSSASGGGAIALGAASRATAQTSVALAFGQATQQGEFNVGTGYDWKSGGYNNTEYRLITGVHDPINAHDAATKGYVDSQGGGVTPVQTTGTSTTDVMSQNAVTGMIFADPGTDTRIQIGSGANGDWTDSTVIGGGATGYGTRCTIIGTSAVSRVNGVAIGMNAKAGTQASHNNAVAVGYNAQAQAVGAIALGRDSSATAQGEMNIGTSNTGWGYNSSNYRLISGVYDGQGAHDAVTVGQVNATIDAINAALSTSIPHVGA